MYYELRIKKVNHNLLFFKIFELPKSRWQAVKDRTVNVPICDDDILRTLNTVKSLPRKPDDAGLIPIQLKRKLEYKNKHVEAFIRPDMLYLAVQKLKDLGHPGYENISVSESHRMTQEQHAEAGSTSSSSCSDSSDDDELDTRVKYQHDRGGATVLTDEYPETNITTPVSQEDKSSSFAIAPAEGKIPTSLMRDETWDTDGFPHLHPSGRFGLHYKRKDKIRDQEYFMQRLMNIDKRWSKNPAYLFSALYYIERLQLESKINISYKRGKVVGGKLVNLEDMFSVFDNVTGTFRYWQQRRYDVLAKLEQLGPFQFFFTLSCADKRWEETFVSILRQRGLEVIYKKSQKDSKATKKAAMDFSYEADEIWVKEPGKEEVMLSEFLATERLHETIRDNVLPLTMNFDKRVHSMRKNIIMGNNSPMHVQFYHYRVEFQKRGAAHIHGVLWADFEELEKQFPGLQGVMIKLRTSEHLSKKEAELTATFVDAFVTCSLDIKDLTEIVEEVQKHTHSLSCKKYGQQCRFGFPRFPSERTIIAQPLREEDFSSKKTYDDETKQMKTTLDKVKQVMVAMTPEEQETWTITDILGKADVIQEKYYKALHVSARGAVVVLKRSPKEMYINNYNPEWIKAWDGNLDLSVCLDFYAVVTYITDYYTKSETGMMTKMKDAAKQCAGNDRKEQMKFLVHTFMTSRQMGESEAYYRLFPHLHLSESNLKTIFVSTGFPWNRSKFSVRVQEQGKEKVLEKNEDSGDEEEPRHIRGTFQIPGKEGSFKEATSIHEKYANRPPVLEHMCLAQFAISYDRMSAQDANKKEFIEGSHGEDSNQIIKSWNSQYETHLPTHICLGKNLGYMRLRGVPAVLRLHKFREDKDPHEYFFSELLLYRPWRNEAELHPHDLEACLRLMKEV